MLLGNISYSGVGLYVDSDENGDRMRHHQLLQLQLTEKWLSSFSCPIALSDAAFNSLMENLYICESCKNKMLTAKDTHLENGGSGGPR